MRTRFNLSVVLIATAAALFGARPASGAPGRVTEVTLYRGQALVTREIPVEGGPGSMELVVDGLPEQIVPDSLFAEGGQQLEVRAVRYRSRAVGQEPREEVRQLEQQIEERRETLRINGRNQELLAKRAAYLDSLEGFVAPTAQTELSKGVLDAEALQQITLFTFEQRREIIDQQIALEQEAQQLQKELNLLERQLAELTARASRTIREAVLFLEKRGEEAPVVRLSYLVNNCGWSPNYTVRSSDGQAVQVEYNALIQQMTGEDWNGVQLTLSTASASLSAAGPGLAPFRVTLGPSHSNVQQQVAKGNADELLSQLATYRDQQVQAINEARNSVNLPQMIGSSWSVNSAANQLQHLEMIADTEVLKTMRGEEQPEGPSFSYALSTNVSLASRSDQQIVRILQSEFPSELYFVATPVLTTYIHREAEVTNNSDFDLLAGPVTVYLDGRFVGRTEIPSVARGQTFVLGFGADPQLRARRELAGKHEDVQGGNRELEFEYRIVVENYKGEAAQLRLYDRLPVAERPSEVRVTLGQMSDPLSNDKLYLRRERAKGILRWDIEVSAGATGENARLVEYNYTAEHDRQFELTLAPGTEQLQKEFEDLQRERSKY